MAFSTDLVKVVVKSGESDWVYLKQGETVVVLGTYMYTCQESVHNHAKLLTRNNL